MKLTTLEFEICYIFSLNGFYFTSAALRASVQTSAEWKIYILVIRA